METAIMTKGFYFVYDTTYIGMLAKLENLLDELRQSTLIDEIGYNYDFEISFPEQSDEFVAHVRVNEVISND